MFEMNLDQLTRRVHVEGVPKPTLEPIQNPAGDHHRAVIRHSNGFGFRKAEMASSTVQATPFWISETPADSGS